MEVDVKKIFDEVVRLRDELAKMQRKYDDLLYNLDDDNFSGKFLKEKNGMKTQIELAADGIKTAVSKTTELDNKVANMSSSITQTADEIRAEVTETYETKENAKSSYSALSSSISVTADKVKSKVSKGDEFSSEFEQTANGFTFDGDLTKFSGVIFLTDKETLKNKFSIFYDATQGYEQIMLHSVETDPLPIVLGNSDGAGEHNVYIGGNSERSRVATRGWVKENPQPAVFG